MHITVLIKGETPSFERCTTCCSKYHCPFCTPDVYRPNELYHVQNHVSNHLKLAVIHHGFTIVKCNLKCRDQAHFHCCFCLATVIRKVQIIQHIKTCRGQSARLPVPAACTSSTSMKDLPSAAVPACAIDRVSAADPMSITDPAYDSEGASAADSISITDPAYDSEEASAADSILITDLAYDSEGASAADPTFINNPASVQISFVPEIPSGARSVHVQTKVQCSHCGLRLYKKNLNIHINRRHKLKITEITDTHHLSSQCIDPLNGIFAVEKSFNSPGCPIHVQKKIAGASSKVVCEMNECNTNIELVAQAGFFQFECIHSKSLQFYTGSVNLEENVLTDMVHGKIFGEQTKTTCINRKKAASAAGVPFTAEVTVGSPSTTKYISVFEPKLSNYSRLGRVMAAYDSSQNTWHCPCVNASKSCIHKNIARWHLFQTDWQLFESSKTTKGLTN